MAVKTKTSERTSAAIASQAAQILSGVAVTHALSWLETRTTDPNASETDRVNAAILLSAFKSARAVAGSALTQR